MNIAVITIELVLPGSGSLQDKRNVMRSVFDKFKKLNVSFAETGDYSINSHSQLTVACVGSNSVAVERVIEYVRNICYDSGADTAVFEVEWM